MGFRVRKTRVRKTDDYVGDWVVADGRDVEGTDCYVCCDGTTSGSCQLYTTKDEAQNAFDLYVKKHELERTFNNHPEEVLEVKSDGKIDGPGTTAPETKLEVKKTLGHIEDHDPLDNPNAGIVRMFNSGATRDTDQGKLDYLKALSPIVIRRYVQYLDKHRKQSDGSYRDFDNWKQGIPEETYISGGGRHFMDTWLLTEGYATEDNHGPVEIEDAICAQLFNLMGRLHEILKRRLDNETK